MATEKKSNGSGIRFALEYNNFLVKIADSEQEVRAAQRLRFEVFNREMNEGLSSSWAEELDRDQYDAHADHLIVIEKNSGDVIGTYRMLTKKIAYSNGGFYSEGEFDLTNLRNLPDEIL